MCSGKTSLLEILGGRNSPTQGGLLSDNRYYDDSTKMSVGFVPQVHKTKK
jgi:ABC-type multidrug transport system ATPase subunit